MKRIIHAVVPAFLLAASVGQIYAFTNFATPVAARLGSKPSEVQFAFSLGIFFLGMGAAFFGRIVERNIKLSTLVGSLLFLGGLAVTQFGVCAGSLTTLYLGYGVLLGLGTGVIYISPVKTMMLWFPKHKALAAAWPIISFGLGSTFSTLLLNRLMAFGIERVFLAYAAVYAPLMAVGFALLKKPCGCERKDVRRQTSDGGFGYWGLVRDPFFLRSWAFMFLNISCGLMLIPLARQMMATEAVGYSAAVVTAVVAGCGVMNGGGRFAFAWLSDRLGERRNILRIILGISLAVTALAFFGPMVGVTLLVINACYGAGFSVIPAILSDHYGMDNLSKIHGAVLSAWGVAGLVGNQVALLVSETLGFGAVGVVTLLCVLYAANYLNAKKLCRVPCA